MDCSEIFVLVERGVAILALNQATLLELRTKLFSEQAGILAGKSAVKIGPLAFARFADN